MCMVIYIFLAAGEQIFRFALIIDKGNLGNAKILGLVKDFGGDPSGQYYALLNGTYFIGSVALRKIR